MNEQEILEWQSRYQDFDIPKEMPKYYQDQKYIEELFVNEKDNIFDIQANKIKNSILSLNNSVFDVIGINDLATNLRSLVANRGTKVYINGDDKQNFNISYILEKHPELQYDYFIRRFLLDEEIIPSTEGLEDSIFRGSFKKLSEALTRKDIDEIYKNFIMVLNQDALPVSSIESDIIAEVLNSYEMFVHPIKNSLYVYRARNSPNIIESVFGFKSKTDSMSWFKKEILLRSYNSDNVELAEKFEFIKNLNEAELEYYLLMYQNTHPYLDDDIKQQYKKWLEGQQIPEYFYKNKVLHEALNIIIPEIETIEIKKPKDCLILQAEFEHQKAPYFKNNIFEIKDQKIIVNKIVKKIALRNYNSLFEKDNPSKIEVLNIKGYIIVNKERLELSAKNIDVMLEFEDDTLNIYWKEHK